MSDRLRSAGLHVRQIEVGQHVGEQGQESVAHVVPEEQNPLRTALEPGAVDHVRFTLQNRPYQVWILPRVVLEIGILDEHDVTAGGLESRPHRRSLAPVLRMLDIGEIDLATLAKLLEELTGTICRTVIDDDDLDFHALLHRGRGDPLEDLLDSLLLVVHRDQNGELHAGGSIAEASARALWLRPLRKQ
jgi:hypothetical protein